MNTLTKYESQRLATNRIQNNNSDFSNDQRFLLGRNYDNDSEILNKIVKTHNTNSLSSDVYDYSTQPDRTLNTEQSLPSSRNRVGQILKDFPTFPFPRSPFNDVKRNQSNVYTENFNSKMNSEGEFETFELPPFYSQPHDPQKLAYELYNCDNLDELGRMNETKCCDDFNPIMSEVDDMGPRKMQGSSPSKQYNTILEEFFKKIEGAFHKADEKTRKQLVNELEYLNTCSSHEILRRLKETKAFNKRKQISNSEGNRRYENDDEEEEGEGEELYSFENGVINKKKADTIKRRESYYLKELYYKDLERFSPNNILNKIKKEYHNKMIEANELDLKLINISLKYKELVNNINLGWLEYQTTWRDIKRQEADLVALKSENEAQLDNIWKKIKKGKQEFSLNYLDNQECQNELSKLVGELEKQKAYFSQIIANKSEELTSACLLIKERTTQFEKISSFLNKIEDPQSSSCLVNEIEKAKTLEIDVKSDCSLYEKIIIEEKEKKAKQINMLQQHLEELSIMVNRDSEEKVLSKYDQQKLIIQEQQAKIKISSTEEIEQQIKAISSLDSEINVEAEKILVLKGIKANKRLEHEKKLSSIAARKDETLATYEQVLSINQGAENQVNRLKLQCEKLRSEYQIRIDKLESRLEKNRSKNSSLKEEKSLCNLEKQVINSKILKLNEEDYENETTLKLNSSKNLAISMKERRQSLGNAIPDLKSRIEELQIDFEQVEKVSKKLDDDDAERDRVIAKLKEEKDKIINNNKLVKEDLEKIMEPLDKISREVEDKKDRLSIFEKKCIESREQILNFVDRETKLFNTIKTMEQTGKIPKKTEPKPSKKK